ncbi:unnamed protein product [Anisakis simplex]|uniref:Protein SHQ1 homolog n=1 Tax=Anisakis simplex TaxID=6269 RepID=A0A0M3K5X4_ANISI|nr:unnamed protein product [Anisakis simplex]
MLTPVFVIKQDDQFLFIDIRAPYANVKDTEIEYDGNVFMFSSKPYFLRLHLSGAIVQTDDGSADYDVDRGCFMVKVPKKTKGEHFENLDMITELLRPQKKLTAEKPVEEIANDGGDEYYVDQSEGRAEEEPLDEICQMYGYGFAWSRHGVLGRLAVDIDNLIDLEDCEESKIDERYAACCAHDQISFQPDHYMYADTMEENEQLEACMQFEFPENCFDVTFQDREHLKELPKRQLPKLSEERNKQLALSLLDILFAYLYDLRTNDGEHNCESGWTIAKLSASLSYLVRWPTARQALIASVRRSLCYPLYRHWDLGMQILCDLKSLLRKGAFSFELLLILNRFDPVCEFHSFQDTYINYLLLSDRSAILHCLIDIRTVFSTSGDFRYLFNDLFMTDYCIWIQAVDDELIKWLEMEIREIDLKKADVELELEEIELEANVMALSISEDQQKQLDSDDEDD